MSMYRRPAWSIAVLLGVLLSQVVAQVTPAPSEVPAGQAEQQMREAFEEFNRIAPGKSTAEEPRNLSPEELTMAAAISDRVSATEWMGALAPVAVSPFFGITCLSGIAIVGEEYLPEQHYLRRASSPLKHPLVFLAFLALTLLTSLPKLSKVSKPFAQACDQLETYGALVILLVIRVIGGIELGADADAPVELVYRAGMLEFTAESLLMLATVINLIVVNTVRFFFEVMIWITPVPLIDAIFELGNKTVCAGLAAIYAWSPTVATVLNLLLMASCLVAFAWVKRREVYYRSMLCHFLRHWLGYGHRVSANPCELEVFPQAPIGSIPKLARCRLTAVDDQWQLEMPRLLRSTRHQAMAGQPVQLHRGLLVDQLGFNEVVLTFGKQNLADFATTYGFAEERPVPRQSRPFPVPADLL